MSDEERALMCSLSARVFRMLNSHCVGTWFISEQGSTTFVVKNVEPLPIKARAFREPKDPASKRVAQKIFVEIDGLPEGKESEFVSREAKSLAKDAFMILEMSAGASKERLLEASFSFGLQNRRTVVITGTFPPGSIKLHGVENPNEQIRALSRVF